MAWYEYNWKHLIKYQFTLINTYITKGLGYGYQWGAVVVWFFIIVVDNDCMAILRKSSIFPIDYWIKYSENLDTDMFFYSLYNSMIQHEKFSDFIGLPWASIESVAGILLIGFLGFIIADNIKNDS